MPKNDLPQSQKPVKQQLFLFAWEPPLPLYIDLNVPALTRSKTPIRKLYQIGISVLYQRIVELEDMVATSISKRFKMDGCVAPACLTKGAFTFGALDNIDHNPTSMTAASSFHGTGIRMFQLPTVKNPGEERPYLQKEQDTPCQGSTLQFTL